MTKRILTLAVLFLISNVLFSQVKKVPFFDGFENNKNDWEVAKTKDVAIDISGGSYNFNHKRKKGGWRLLQHLDLDGNKDFKIETLIVKKSGVDNAGYGLMWGKNSSNDYYWFNITSNGYYRVSKRVNGSFTDLVKWTKSDAIKKGNGKYNILKIEKIGNKVNYYVNDTKVETLNFTKLYGDEFGFLLYNKQAIEINYLSVYYLSKKKSKPKPIVTKTAKKLPFFDGFENNDNTWPVSNNSSGVIKVSGGSYNLNYKKDKGALDAFNTVTINDSKDFKIETLIVKKSGVDDYGYGLIWGKKDSDNYYSFNITSNGNYRISKNENGSYKNLVAWKESTAVKTGDGIYNILRIEKIGNKVIYYINDKEVETLDFEGLFGNKVGFVVYHAQAIEVNYISIYYINKNKKDVVVNNNYQSDVIFQDDFNSNAKDWATTNNENAKLSIKNGFYNFNHKRDKFGWTSTKEIKVNETKDFEIEADIKKIAGILNNGYGLIWGRKDSENEFEFFVSGDGYYQIKYYEDDKLISIKDWAKSSYLKTGNGVYNKLKIRKEAGQFKFYINDNYIMQSPAKSFFGDRIGFVVYGNQSIAINSLKVNYISKKAVPSNYLFYDEFSDNSNNWASGSTDKYDFNFSSGKYYLDHKRETGGWSTSIEKYIDESKDYEIETRILKISGIDNNGFGIMWGRKSSGNTFEFNLASNGLYSVDRSENSNRNKIIDWTSSSYIKKGNYAYNTLKIRKQDGVIKFYINGSYVNQINNKSFLGNRIGFIIYDKQKIAIDYLKIKYLEKKVITPNVVVTTKKEAWSDTFSNNSNDWATGSKTEYNLSFSGGYYNFEHKRTTGGWSSTMPNKIDQTRNFEISTEIKKVSGAQNYAYGLVWGRKDSKNQFNFTLSGNGSFKIKKTERDNTILLQDWTKSPYIKTGNGATNTLSIRKIKSTLNFYINNSFVASKEFTPFLGDRLGYIIFANQKIAINNLTVKYIKADVTNSPPTIVITEPAVTRGFKIVKAKRITVRGKATDTDGIYEVTINGVDAALQADGSFVAQVPLRVGDNNLNVKATDLKYASTMTKFIIKREVKPIVIVDPVIDDNDKKEKLVTDGGTYYALLIGVSDYNDSKIVSLDGMPTDDIQNLADALKGYYTFSDENVEVLSNPTRSKIIRAFDRLKKKITPKDNLLVFYAGHGTFIKEDNLGYWLPSDAEADYTDNWINNSAVKDFIKSIKSKHTLLISDACFSGSIFKTRAVTLNKASKSIQKKYELPSRKAITSGTLKTVPNVSVFIKYLLDRLENNTDAYLAAHNLFMRIEEPVGNNSPNTPQYGTIQGVGDEGGDFIFIRKN